MKTKTAKHTQASLTFNTCTSPLVLRWDDVTYQYKVNKPLDQSGKYVDKAIADDMAKAIEAIRDCREFAIDMPSMLYNNLIAALNKAKPREKTLTPKEEARIIAEGKANVKVVLEAHRDTMTEWLIIKRGENNTGVVIKSHPNDLLKNGIVHNFSVLQVGGKIKVRLTELSAPIKSIDYLTKKTK